MTGTFDVTLHNLMSFCHKPLIKTGQYINRKHYETPLEFLKKSNIDQITLLKMLFNWISPTFL